ncbi:MAG: BMP family ABC transporter substrate-binding protein [Chloroflexi bacterium RBG_19FT_COMBO_50_10]|nr:MAG: BMP family ABC transporter substrate-binding protein [Chloroflexi bacterium RBG_19FT_COMBO_50_10]
MGKKLSFGMALLIIATLFLAACQPEVISEADCPKAEVVCVGLVTGLDGVHDKSINQSAWDGVLKAQAEKAVDWVRYIETVDSKDSDQNITTFAGAGYDLIVTVGSDLAESTTTAAKNFPGLLFIGVDQDQEVVYSNLVGLVFHADQSGFLAGALAAQMTRTNTIAAVLGSNTVPSVKAFKEGFEAGARYINPNINIISTYYSGRSEAAFTDPRWGADTAAQAIQNSADVITGAGGRTGNGALIETASHTGLYCIGVDVDQWETVPDAHPCLITSSVKLVAPGVFDLIKMARDGSFPTGSYFGASGLAPYHDFESTIPQAVKDKINQITTGLNGGSITTGYTPGG